MKIVNNNIRAAKRRRRIHFGLHRNGYNGTSSEDFDGPHGQIRHGTHNRTQEKSEKDVNQKECESTSESP